MIILQDLTSNDTTNLTLCQEKALFLSNVSWWSTADLIVVTVFVSIIVFAASVAMDWKLLWKEAETVVMSEGDQSDNEMALAVQTIGVALLGMCSLIFWLAIQKSRYCTYGFPEPWPILVGIVVHGVFPSTAMSWINNLRDVCTGTQRRGSHRLCWGQTFMALLGGLLCSPVLIICLGCFGLKQFYHCCHICHKRRNLESRPAESGTELATLDTIPPTSAHSSNEQSKEIEWDAETVVDSR